MQTNESSKPAEAQSFLTGELERICREVEEEYGATGLTGGIYEDFAKEVALRAVLAEREACAKCVPDNWLDSLLTGPKAVVGNLGTHSVEAILKAVKARIMERSNAELSGPRPLAAEGSRSNDGLGKGD